MSVEYESDEEMYQEVLLQIKNKVEPADSEMCEEQTNDKLSENFASRNNFFNMYDLISDDGMPLMSQDYHAHHRED